MIIIFDSLIIDKHYRKKGISKIILESSVKQIFKKKLECYLYCEKILQKYYEKYGWKRVNKKKLNLLNKTKLILMKFK
jgi:N-acetylglutamate synthase-like GNAT family acetyltransferase